MTACVIMVMSLCEQVVRPALFCCTCLQKAAFLFSFQLIVFNTKGFEIIMLSFKWRYGSVIMKSCTAKESDCSMMRYWVSSEVYCAVRCHSAAKINMLCFWHLVKVNYEAWKELPKLQFFFLAYSSVVGYMESRVFSACWNLIQHMF